MMLMYMYATPTEVGLQCKPILLQVQLPALFIRPESTQ